MLNPIASFNIVKLSETNINKCVKVIGDEKIKNKAIDVIRKSSLE